MTKCTICEIILSNKQSFNTQSSNPERCKDCVFVEERIKNKCGLCGASYPNNLRLYSLFGNTCNECNKKINARIHYKECLKRIPLYESKILSIKQEVELKESRNYVEYYKKNYPLDR